MGPHSDEDRVQCHLCGEWFRIVGGAHLARKHGWALREYRERFGLLSSDPTCSPGVSTRLRAHAVRRIASGELKSPGAPPRKTPATGGRRVRRSRSLGALRPDLVAQLDPNRNKPLDPFRLAVMSGRRLWWRCPSCDHDWQAAPTTAPEAMAARCAATSAEERVIVACPESARSRSSSPNCTPSFTQL
jgi:hypothetical protein